MKLFGHHKGSFLHHGLPIQASLNIIHNRRFSISSSSQTRTEGDKAENTLECEGESQRRFLSKLANDLSIHDVCSLSLSDFFSQLIFRYFRFIIHSSILIHPNPSSSILILPDTTENFFLFVLSSSEFRMVSRFQKGSDSTRRRKVVSVSFFTC